VSCHSGGSDTEPDTVGNPNEDVEDEMLNYELKVAVNGRGYFILENAEGDRRYRRSATLGLNGSGNIVTENGDKLQGLIADTQGRITGGNPRNFELPADDTESLEIDDEGVIRATIEGNDTLIGQFLLAQFDSPYQLEQDSPGNYVESLLTGRPSVNVPGVGPMGTLFLGSDIASPVDYTLELEAPADNFFVLKQGADLLFATSVRLFRDKDGFLIDDDSNRLMVFNDTYPIRPIGEEVVDYDTLELFQVRNRDIDPRSTVRIDLKVNLDSEDVPVREPFDFTDDSTYNYAFDMQPFDDLGLAHSLTFYFSRTDTPGEWLLHYNFQADDGYPHLEQPTAPQVGGPFFLDFDTIGTLITYPAVFSPDPIEIWNGATNPIDPYEFHVGELSQLPATYSGSVQQDGYHQGRIMDMVVGGCGKSVLSASNGVDYFVGHIALARFDNPDDLASAGEGYFRESGSSGELFFTVPCDTINVEMVGDHID
jgi:flagellar hook protein FlgE